MDQESKQMNNPNKAVHIMSLKSKLVYLNSLVAKFYYIPSLLAWVVTLWRETSSTNQIRRDLQSAKIILVHTFFSSFPHTVIILNLLLYF